MSTHNTGLGTRAQEKHSNTAPRSAITILRNSGIRQKISLPLSLGQHSSENFLYFLPILVREIPINGALEPLAK